MSASVLSQSNTQLCHIHCHSSTTNGFRLHAPCIQLYFKSHTYHKVACKAGHNLMCFKLYTFFLKHFYLQVTICALTWSIISRCENIRRGPQLLGSGRLSGSEPIACETLFIKVSFNPCMNIASRTVQKDAVYHMLTWARAASSWISFTIEGSWDIRYCLTKSSHPLKEVTLWNSEFILSYKICYIPSCELSHT